MKKHYENPELMIEKLNIEDVITDSVTGGMGGANEGEAGGMP